MKKLKKSAAILLSLIIALSVFAAAPVTTQAADNTNALIDAVMNSQNVWNTSTWRSQSTMGYGRFQFLDLNFDGTPEFIVTMPGGTMRNSSSTVYYLSNGSLVKAGGGDPSDIISHFSSTSLNGYYDNNTHAYKLLGKAMMMSSMSSFWQGSYQLTFDGKNVGVNYYAANIQTNSAGTQYKSYYNGSKSYGDTSGASKISESSFNQLLSARTSNCEDIGLWSNTVNADAWNKYDALSRRTVLKESIDSLFYKHYTAKPAAPTVSLSNQDSGLLATWNAVPGAVRYIVYYRQNNISSWNQTSTTYTSFSFAKVTPGVMYCVQVQSVGANNYMGNYSNVARIVRLPRPNITLGYYNQSSGNRLSWTGNNGITAYQIAKKQAGSSSYQYINTTGTAYTDSNVSAGTSYVYQVRSYYIVSGVYYYSQWSSSYVVNTIAMPDVSLSNKSNGIRAEWNSIRGAVKYIVYYRRAQDSNWSYAETRNTYYPLLNVSSGTMYCVQVRPIGSSVNGPYSNVKSMTFVAPASNVKATAYLDKYITVTWNAVPGANQYVVAKKAAGASSYEYYYANGTYIKDVNVISGTTYVYQVQATYATQNNGTARAIWSSSAVAAALAKPELFVTNRSNGIRAEWTPVRGAAKYIVYYRRAQDSRWQSVETRNTYYPFFNVTEGTEYCFQVRVENSYGYGLYSDVNKLIFVLPPEVIYYEGLADGVGVGTDYKPGTLFYEIAMKRVGTSGYIYRDGISPELYFRNLEPYATYEFQLRYYYLDGDRRKYSDWSDVFYYTQPRN